MNNSIFAEATGLLRAVEKKILTTSSIERIVDATSDDEALKMISQNSEMDFSHLEHSEEYEDVLKSELRRVYEFLYKVSPSKELVDVLAVKYDYHNIKVAIKAHYLKENYDSIFTKITNIDPEDIKEAITAVDIKNLPEHLAKAVKKGVGVYEETRDPQAVDIIIDKLMFEYILELCKIVESDFITTYVRNTIDFYNAKTLLRVKNMQKGRKFLSDSLVDGGLVKVEFFEEHYDKAVESFSESFFYKYFGDVMRKAIEGYEKANTFAELERATDNYLIEKIKESKYVAFGPEPLFSYIVAKENEIKQVRILVTCKANNISNEILRERLRDNYA